MGTRQGHESQAIEDLRSYGRSLVGTLTPGATEAMVGRAIAARYRRRRPRALVLALAILGLLAISNVGLAAVSDAAVPGDLLYPFDRGYEWAGDLFGARDRTLERLAESEVLSLRGETQDAIDLLRDELAVGSSNQQLLVAAIQELQAQADNANQGQGNPSDSGPATPAITAPGQIPGSPSDTAPGQIPGSPSDTAPGQVPGSPSDDAPGQTKDAEAKDNPSDDAPGQNKDATTTTAEAGNGNGNGGNGNGNGNGTGN
jgi:hypothetical protein